MKQSCYQIQEMKGLGWIPWHLEAMKDAVTGEMLRELETSFDPEVSE